MTIQGHLCASQTNQMNDETSTRLWGEGKAIIMVIIIQVRRLHVYRQCSDAQSCMVKKWPECLQLSLLTINKPFDKSNSKYHLLTTSIYYSF